MGVKIWLVMGAVTGLAAGLLLEGVLDMPPLYMRLMQVAMIVFGAMIAAFVYEGARAVTAGREPNLSTDRPRRRWTVNFLPRRRRS